MRVFTIDFIEQKKELFFVAGLALQPIVLGDSFTAVYQYGKSQSSKQSKGTVDSKSKAF
jgi:hypothetical protein